MADLSGSRHFEQLYGASDDPWSMRERWYEARKRALALACLPARRYRSGFEPGCANGELSAALAGRCQRLLISDFNAQAVQLARQRVRDLPQVQVEQRAMPHEWPAQPFDLIVISELAYYLDAAELALLVAQAVASLTPDGTLLACHWRRAPASERQSAAQVHAAFNAHGKLQRLACHLEADFIMETWSLDGRSVAEREGWL